MAGGSDGVITCMAGTGRHVIISIGRRNGHGDPAVVTTAQDGRNIGSGSSARTEQPRTTDQYSKIPLDPSGPASRAVNGRLPVTYADFVKFGVRRNSIREAINIAMALGWIDRTSVGEVPWHGDSDPQGSRTQGPDGHHQSNPNTIRRLKCPTGARRVAL
jgi:hypothetical protein